MRSFYGGGNMRRILPFVLALSLISFVLIDGPVKAQEATPQLRKLLAAVAKDKLDPELAKTPIEFHESGRETKTAESPLGDIVIHVDWEIKVDGEFSKPKKNSKFEIHKLVKQEDKSYEFEAEASSPINGEISGEIKKLAKGKTKFTSDVKLTVEGKLIPDEPGRWKVKVNKWEGKFSDLTLDWKVPSKLDELVQKVANDLLEEKNAEIKDKANVALEEAAAVKLN